MCVLNLCQYDGSDKVRIKDCDPPVKLTYRVVDFSRAANEDVPFSEIDCGRTVGIPTNSVLEFKDGAERKLFPRRTGRIRLVVRITRQGSQDVLSFVENNARVHVSRFWLETHGGVKYYLGGDGLISGKSKWILSADETYKPRVDAYCAEAITVVND